MYYTHVWCKACTHKKLWAGEVWHQVTTIARFLDFINLTDGSFAFTPSNNGRNVWATVLFLSAIMHRNVIHVSFFFVFFFCRICRTTVCWDPEILLPWQRNVTTSFSVNRWSKLNQALKTKNILHKNVFSLTSAKKIKIYILLEQIVK